VSKLAPTLALRGRVARSQAGAPIQFAATVGGGSTLRGFRSGRFTGDTAASWGAELRLHILRGNFRLVKGEIGAIAFLDSGRVWAGGEGSGGWHYGRGAGLWFGMLNRSLTAHLVYARGERGSLYAGLGMPF
jgi:hemolysin activation/secretion protein